LSFRWLRHTAGQECPAGAGKNACTTSAAQCGHLVEDLALGRETAFLFLREDGFAVDRDDEDSTAAADDLALDREFPFDLSRQTGGSWEVVSNAAVVDSNMHMRN
jgi:hypothetical protein